MRIAFEIVSAKIKIFKAFFISYFTFFYSGQNIIVKLFEIENDLTILYVLILEY